MDKIEKLTQEREGVIKKINQAQQWMQNVQQQMTRDMATVNKLDGKIEAYKEIGVGKCDKDIRQAGRTPKTSGTDNDSSTRSRRK